MWLLNSSIGKKLIMSISGIFLILFLLFHLSMNVAAVFSGEAYDMICGMSITGGGLSRPFILFAGILNRLFGLRT